MADDEYTPTWSVDDAAMTQDDLIARFAPGSRYRDWRELLQTRCWFDSMGGEHPLDDMNRNDLEDLQQSLRAKAGCLHEQAAIDERYTMSSALAWTYATLGVPLTQDVHPLVWLDTTPLLQSIRRRLVG